MSFNSDRQVIEQFFIDNLLMPLRFEGHDYSDQTVPFVGVIIVPLNRDNETVDNSITVDGFIRARIFTERNTGTKEILDLCDQISSLLDNITIGTIKTFAAGAPVDLNTEVLYTAKEISIPYYNDL